MRLVVSMSWQAEESEERPIERSTILRRGETIWQMLTGNRREMRYAIDCRKDSGR